MMRITLWSILLFLLICPLLLSQQLDQQASAEKKSSFFYDAAAVRVAPFFIGAYKGNADAARSAFVLAGGTVVGMIPELNMIIAQADNASFANSFADDPRFDYVMEDKPLQWLSDAGKANQAVAAPSLSKSGSASGDPALAYFYDKQWYVPLIQADQAWGITQGSPDVKVAVIDTGICAHHIDLAGKVDASSSASFVPWFAEPYDSCEDCPYWEDYNFHGTHVAGLISTNNIGVAGVAPNVRLRAVKVLNYQGSGFAFSILAGIVHAVNTGNNVLNLSLGLGPTDHAFVYHPDPSGGAPPIPLGRTLLQTAFSQAISWARSRGVVVVAAAGNEGFLLNPGEYVVIPCQSGSTLCVGSTTFSEELSEFSNHGTNAPQIMAPGGGMPVPVTAVDNLYLLSPCSKHSVLRPDCGAGDYYIGAYGTSMATPIVSGTAALIFSAIDRGARSIPPGGVESLLLRSADDLGHAGVDEWFSHGRLNIFRALQAATK